MPIWSDSMQQTYEYYTVNPNTWRDDTRIKTIKSCSITRDSEVETLGSATFDITGSLGECYVRVYLVTVQNGVTERHPLGTYLVQTPSSSFSGKVQTASVDAYTPLLELKEKSPPIGYSIPKGTNIMDVAYMLVRDNARAPVSKPQCDAKLFYDFVADPNDTWLSFLIALISNAKYSFSLDEMGRILFAPQQSTASLQYVDTFSDGDDSILYPEISVSHDIYEIPNVVEVIYSSGSDSYYAKVVNDDPNSPVSTISRGREIVKRVTDPDLIGDPTENQIQDYAERLLKNCSSIECEMSFSHGYRPVRLGDCVRIDYRRAGLMGIKAKIISQSISCTLGCSISERAVFTKDLWGNAK